MYELVSHKLEAIDCQELTQTNLHFITLTNIKLFTGSAHSN